MFKAGEWVGTAGSHANGGLLRCTLATGVELSRSLMYTSKVRPAGEETPNMSNQAHLAELERRHRALEQEINEALAHPSIDDLKLAELKRRKLQVKDEIARLRQDASIH
jgi:hypothetical protein